MGFAAVRDRPREEAHEREADDEQDPLEAVAHAAAGALHDLLVGVVHVDGREARDRAKRRLLLLPALAAFLLIIVLKTMQEIKKASFNNVFTFKNLSYMSLHAISVFDKV